MTLRPIRTKRDYEAALKETEKLWNAPAGSAKGDRLEVLVLLIQAYETKHFPVPDPDPIDFLQHVMEARGLTRKNLEPWIGSRARVAEVLNRVRPLSLEMIRRFSTGLNPPRGRSGAAVGCEARRAARSLIPTPLPKSAGRHVSGEAARKIGAVPHAPASYATPIASE